MEGEGGRRECGRGRWEKGVWKGKVGDESERGRWEKGVEGGGGRREWKKKGVEGEGGRRESGRGRWEKGEGRVEGEGGRRENGRGKWVKLCLGKVVQCGRDNTPSFFARCLKLIQRWASLIFSNGMDS